MLRFIGLCCLVLPHTEVFALMLDQHNGKLGAQMAIYSQDGNLPSQDYKSNLSVFFQSEFHWRWNQDRDGLNFVPYLRIDQRDHTRSRADIRELMWKSSREDWDINIGLGKVFWGVTEFNHLVDVINQTDLIESIDGEEKLGQLMINLSVVKNWGTLNFFLLPGFRERTFPGVEGRLRTLVLVDSNNARYESPDGDQHVDFAIRWSNTFRYFDVGAYVFEGTNRDPTFIMQSTVKQPQNTDLIAIPHYQQITQLGIDAQATVGSWLFKLEALRRKTAIDQYIASQLGIEYTFYNLVSSDADVGLLVEYGWDGRGAIASSMIQNDIFIGARITFNDFESAECLLGIAYDQDFFSNSASLEFTRRIFTNTKLSLEARIFNPENIQDPLQNIAHDDHIQLNLEHFF
jgi:hypothetical protein